MSDLARTIAGWCNAPLTDTEQVVWVDVVGWPRMKVNLWCCNLQNRRCMDSILLTAGLGSWDGVVFRRRRVPVVNGPDRWEDDNIKIWKERETARCRPWDGDPMYAEKNRNTIACAMDPKIIDILENTPLVLRTVLRL